MGLQEDLKIHVYGRCRIYCVRLVYLIECCVRIQSEHINWYINIFDIMNAVTSHMMTKTPVPIIFTILSN